MLHIMNSYLGEDKLYQQRSVDYVVCIKSVTNCYFPFLIKVLNITLINGEDKQHILSIPFSCDQTFARSWLGSRAF